MNQTERFYRIDQLLHERRVVPIEVFLEVLGISRATFKRDMAYLCDRLNAPIVWDRVARGYRFSTATTVGPRYELPGLWFSASELHALLAAQKLLADIEPGLLAPHLAPLQSRLSAMLEAGGQSADVVSERVRLLSMGKRSVPSDCFSEVALALMARKRIEVVAYSRERDETLTRILSPQRLVYYRDNWYLDAWCHLRKGLRSFALDTLRSVHTLNETAREVAARALDAHCKAGYGIFAGEVKGWAELRFSAERARWVRGERWHPEQQTLELPGGELVLKVPYSDERELLMDILRHGQHLEVLAPASLRAHVAEEVQALAEVYQHP